MKLMNRLKLDELEQKLIDMNFQHMLNEMTDNFYHTSGRRDQVKKQIQNLEAKIKTLKETSDER